MDSVLVRETQAEDRKQVIAFLRSERYDRPIAESDRVFAGYLPDGKVVGVARLSVENEVLVLRGMRVRQDLQRRGIGRQILAVMEPEIGRETCYCIPHGWLEGFYGEIGFERIESADAPAFLSERLERYRGEGLDVVLMCRSKRKNA